VSRSRAVVFALPLALALLPAAAPAQQVIATATEAVGNLVRTELTVQVGPGPLDRFQMVRLAKDRPPEKLRGAILFLPPLGSSFSFYEQPDESGAAGSSLAGFFAERDYDVYGYTPRYVGIPAGTCEAGLFDCSVMDGWDLQSLLDDIAFIRGRIEALHPGAPIVAGGASLGGILAVAVANAAPGDYDGVLVWEGMLASDDPAVQALNDGYCDALEAQLAAGVVFDGVGTNVFKQVAKAAELERGGLNLVPLFPPSLTNHQVLVLLLAVTAPGPVSMPVPNYVQMNGSFADDRLFFASEPRLFENVGQFNSYVPVRLVRDVSCALAGRDARHVSSLGSFTGSVLAIGGGRGFGPFLPDQLARFGTSDVTFLLEPDFGHIDHFMTEDHRAYVERPVLEWAKRVLGRRGGS
jgi:hypothetical protein